MSGPSSFRLVVTQVPSYTRLSPPAAAEDTSSRTQTGIVRIPHLFSATRGGHKVRGEHDADNRLPSYLRATRVPGRQLTNVSRRGRLKKLLFGGTGLSRGRPQQHRGMARLQQHVKEI